MDELSLRSKNLLRQYDDMKLKCALTNDEQKINNNNVDNNIDKNNNGSKAVINVKETEWTWAF